MSRFMTCPICGQPAESLSEVGVCESCLSSSTTRRSLVAQGYDVPLHMPVPTIEMRTIEFPYDLESPTIDFPDETVSSHSSTVSNQLALLTQRGLHAIQEYSRGGMGNVYLAEEVSSQRRVVVKFMRQHNRAESRRRFLQEVQTLATFHHPSIVQLLGTEVDAETPYFVMEWMEYGGLDSLVRDARRNGQFLPVNDVVEYLESAARGIHHVHEHRITHCDLKPSNILLTQDAEGWTVAKVADFGLARRMGEEDPFIEDGDIVGTPGYMAPEQVMGQACDARTDVYGLGATLYAMLCGQAPFGTGMRDILAIIRDALTRPSAHRPDLPRDLEAICLKALQRDPRHRYASAKEFADDLQRFLHGVPTLARPRSWAMRQWVLVRQIPRVVACASFFFMLTLVFSFIMHLNHHAQLNQVQPARTEPNLPQ